MMAEARNFPELARVWHDELVAHALGAMAGAVAAAQARGDAGKVDVPESLLARRDEWERLSAEMPARQAAAPALDPAQQSAGHR